MSKRHSLLVLVAVSSLGLGASSAAQSSKPPSRGSLTSNLWSERADAFESLRRLPNGFSAPGCPLSC